MGERGVVLPNATQCRTNRLANTLARAFGRVGQLAIAPAQADCGGQFVVHELKLSADSLSAAGVVHPFSFIEIGAQLRKARTVVSLGLAVEDRWGILPIRVNVRVGGYRGEPVAVYARG